MGGFLPSAMLWAAQPRQEPPRLIAAALARAPSEAERILDLVGRAFVYLSDSVGIFGSLNQEAMQCV